MEVLYIVLLVLFLLAGVAMIFFALPGTFVMVGATFLYGWATHFETVPLKFIGILLAVAVGLELLEEALGAAMARRVRGIALGHGGRLCRRISGGGVGHAHRPGARHALGGIRGRVRRRHAAGGAAHPGLGQGAQGWVGRAHGRHRRQGDQDPGGLDHAGAGSDPGVLRK